MWGSYFRYENEKKITYFLQQQFELFEKGTKFDSKFKDNIITLSTEGMSYRGIFKLYKGLISIGTIHNIISTHSLHNLVSIDYKKMVKSLKISTLYIEVDDSYHYLKNSVSAEKVRNRMVAIHAGKDKNRVIIGKTILLESKFLSQNHLNNYDMSMLIKKNNWKLWLSEVRFTSYRWWCQMNKRYVKTYKCFLYFR